ncbi:MAG: glutathione S-transferase family protein [Sphingomonadaceae bacterium]|nr:glutathione S-transferase family protein [Sphingomonadaceae bacterium]
MILHAHPLSSYCWKVLIALYEKELDFELRLVNLGDPEDRAAFAALWPLAKMPVLEDPARAAIVPETSIIIDYLDVHHPGAIRLIPEEADAARGVRLWDRIFDLHVQTPMQRIIADRLRPPDAKDAYGVAEARASLAIALATVEREVAGRKWACGEAFTLADCAAAPALFYADKVMPFGAEHPAAAGLLERLKARPSFARVLAEAEPWFQYFPAE